MSLKTKPKILTYSKALEAPIICSKQGELLSIFFIKSI